LWSVMAFASLGEGSKATALFSTLNPINHARSRAELYRYKVEPYVVTADVYAVSPHVGRGGWSWYTGSSGWLYRLIVESLLGVTREGNQLRVKPCMPADWDSYKLHYRYGASNYAITIEKAQDQQTGLSLDGVAVEGDSITLADESREYVVLLRL